MTGEQLRILLKEKGYNMSRVAEKLNITPQTLNSRLNAKTIKDEFIEELENALNESLSIVRQEAVFLNDPNVIYVPLISQYAQAGYLCGFTDPEFIDTLPKIPIVADHQLKGDYLSFEVRGDSMDDGTSDSLKEGDVLVCRIVRPDLWKYKLHINDWDFVIVHKEEGIIVKRIIDHCPETGDFTIHSLNSFYSDKKMNLKDVAQLFNVVQVLRSRRR